MSNINIRFIDPHKDKTLFFATLRKRVEDYFKEKNLSKHHNPEMVIKTVILLSAYLLPFISILTFKPGPLVSIILWLIMGFAIAGIGMSIMHDANHGAYLMPVKHLCNLLSLGVIFFWIVLFIK